MPSTSWSAIVSYVEGIWAVWAQHPEQQPLEAIDTMLHKGSTTTTNEVGNPNTPNQTQSLSQIPSRAPPSLSAPSQTELIAVAPTTAPSHRRHLLSCAAPEVTFVASYSLSRLTSSHSQKHRRAISRSVVWSPSLLSLPLPTQVF
ncbi:hypothetical protein PIB30_072062 [Stylosanthes scabra]|uniref:Uncharacterized protein n=1 Tax=Stylosanthes scabra TaxID=79078 RepID=A0ABU6SQ09_9FABA|nr:hypothetical protein [Stylosanthes scabra]